LLASGDRFRSRLVAPFPHEKHQREFVAIDGIAEMREVDRQDPEFIDELTIADLRAALRQFDDVR
jgi:hypothetical protein